MEVVERGFPEIDASQVCIKVQAKVSAIAVLTKEGLFPGIEYPVSGHDVAITTDITEKVSRNGSPDKGWPLQFLSLGDFITCFNAQVPGISYDVGYTGYMVSPPLQHLQIS